jgi:replicative DNA helicase
VQTLDRVVRRGAQQSHGIPMPFAGLARIGFQLAKGQLGMIAAAPGVGKSALAQQIALSTGLRTLYVSADTDAWTMTVRTLAHNTGHPQSYIEECLRGGYERDAIDVALWEAQNVTYSFDSYSMAEIRDDVLAYGVVNGSYPELIVVDNVMNIARGGDDDLSSQTKAMDEMHAMAQATGAHVLALHHATGAFDDGDKAIPLSGLANKLSKLPAQVLTLFRKDPYIHVCVVKNRQGQANPGGGLQVRLRFDPERMTFTETD